MKTKRLWAHVRHWLLLLGLACAGLSAASPAVAQQEYPSSLAPGPFSPWSTMNSTMFKVDPIALLEQCHMAESTRDWLKLVHCSHLIEMEERGQYEVVWIDKIKLDILLGRVDSDPDKNARVHHNQEMQLGRLVRALLFNLGDGVYAYWFTGERGKSCNNLAFVHIPIPKQITKPTAKWVCRKVSFNNSTPATAQLMQGFVLPDCCCGNNTYIPGLVRSAGDAIQSNGYTIKCGYEQADE